MLVVSMSEAAPDLISRLCAAGRLPNLQRIHAEGSVGRLAYGIPALNTPQLWATICTGRSAGWHGIFDYWHRGHKGHFEEVRGAQLQAEPIWRLLSLRGIPSGIVNVPMTYPPEAIRGFMVAGQDAPGAHWSIAHPRRLYSEVTSRFGRYRLKDIFPGGRSKADYLKLVEEETRWQADVAEHLLRSEEWQFALVHFVASAFAQHYFWADHESDDPYNPYRDVIARCYAALDEALGRLAEVAGAGTTLFVISECGAGPLRSGIQFNTWLAQEGFLRFRRARLAGADTFGKRLRALVSHTRTKGEFLLPRSWYFAANQHARGLKSWLETYMAGSDIEWSETRAYFRGKGESNLYVNLRGRDPHGIVAPGDDYDSLCSQLTERLLDLQDPTSGQPAVRSVHRSSDLFSGPHAQLAPDLIVEWQDAAYMPTESDRDKERIFVERWRQYMTWPTTGSHRPEGLLAVSGPDVRCGQRVGTFDLRDLVPTWLHLLKEPVPARLEGRVIDEILRTAVVS